MSENERQQIIIEWLQAKADESVYQASCFRRGKQPGMAVKWERRSHIFKKMLAEERGDPIDRDPAEIAFGRQRLERWKDAVVGDQPGGAS